MGKKSKIFLVSLLVLSIFIYAFANDDDELNKKAAELIKTFNSQENTHTNGHLYALGIHAPNGENPEELGSRIQKNYLKYLKSDLTLVNDGPQGILVENSTKLPDKNHRCNIETIECIDYFLSQNLTELKKHLITHQTILQRYQKLLNFDTHYYTSPPGLHSPIPEYQYVLEGNRLLLINSIIDIKDNQKQNISQTILNNIKRHRLLLENSTSLIEKIIHSVIIKNDIGFLSTLTQKSYIESSIKIAHLTNEELSMLKPFQFEFVMTSSIFNTVSNTNYLFSKNYKLPKFISKILIKKNRSINASLKGYDFYFNNDLLSASQYMQAVNKELSEMNTQRNYNFKNFVGDILLQIAKPQYSNYKYRLFNLDQKIKLFNAYIVNNQYKLNNWDTSATTSIYDSTKNSEIRDSKICLYSPLDQKKASSCLEIIN